MRLIMNIIHDIERERISPEKFVAVVEVSKNSKNKYELDKATGMLKLDRILYTSTHYPANYGCIPLTLSEDNDPLDVFVYCVEPLVPMSLVECTPIGAVDMVDGGEKDTKIIAVPVGDPTYKNCKEINDLPAHLIDELMHFLTVYKQLETNVTQISKFHDSGYATRAITRCMKAYNKAHK